MEMLDLFGAPVQQPKPARAQVDERLVPVINRKQVWSANDFAQREVIWLTPGKAESKKLVKATFSDDQSLECIERKLQMRFKVKAGESSVVRDEHGPVFQLYGRPITGRTTFSSDDWPARQRQCALLIDMARERISQCFAVPDNWLCRKALLVLETRLRIARRAECPEALVMAFVEVLCQHDFIENQRAGITIRAVTRAEQMRDLRAARAAAKKKPAAKPKPVKVAEPAPVEEEDDDEWGEDEWDDDPDRMVMLEEDF